MKGRVEQVRLAGIAAAVPARRERITDSDYADAETRAKFSKQAGIEERRRVGVGECTSDLCAAAAERLLDELGWARDGIDLLVFVTQTADYRLPATAATLQHRLGLSRHCAAFDVNLGCSGYVYGISMVAGLMRAYGAARALLLVGETASIGPADLVPLFGDAGTASAFELSPDAPVLYTDMQTDGSGAHVIMQKRGGYRTPYAEDTPFVEVIPGVRIPDAEFVLDGIEVFNFSVREVPAAVRDLLAYAGADADDVDAFVFHQANGMINDMIRKLLGLPAERVPSTLRDFANTSSASIPLTIVTALGERLRQEPLTVLMCGFGVGLSWCTVLMEAGPLVCPELIEV